jgi:tetratricopeptide (TPR) repeat protein
LIFLIGFLYQGCHKNQSHDDFENEIELDIMKQGSAYLEDGDYDRANMVYLQFIEKFPDNPYTDDAAYRLAYMCVIADDKNPYFDYTDAAILFQNFIENYPNSRYIIACNNWLNLLKSVMINSKESSLSPISKRLDPNEIKQLRIELIRVKAENARLKNTLEELQKAIER